MGGIPAHLETPVCVLGATGAGWSAGIGTFTVTGTGTGSTKATRAAITA